MLSFLDLFLPNGYPSVVNGSEILGNHLDQNDWNYDVNQVSIVKSSSSLQLLTTFDPEAAVHFGLIEELRK